MMASVDTPTTTTGEVTYEEFLAMPVTNRHVEVVDGMIQVLPAPTYFHQRRQLRIASRLESQVDNLGLGLVLTGPADIVIRDVPKLRVRQPDVMFFSDRKAGFQTSGDPDRLFQDRIAPDLVVEVLSPGQDESSLADYASIAVEEVCFADQEANAIRVLRLEGAAYCPVGEYRSGERLKSAVLPGIALDVTAIFA